MIRRLLRNEKGFTMVEMMVVMIIIAVLAAGGIKFYQGYIEKAKIIKAKAQISTMQAALDTYYAEYGKYPFGDKKEDFEDQMLNAGLVVTATSKQDATFDVADPWGESYIYYSKTDGTDMEYYIRTGWKKKLDDENDPTVVFGKGSGGTSKAPDVGKLSEL